MKRLTVLPLIAALFAAVLIAPAHAEVDQDNAAAPLLKITGKHLYQDAAIPESLANEFKPIAFAIHAAEPTARFTQADKVLIVSLHKAPELSIEHQSDCPNNSQYQVRPLVRIDRTPPIERVLLAWTKYRHGEPDARLKTVRLHNINTPGGGLNFDVQLHLPDPQPVASVSMLE